jgi:hypothetical protein
MAINIVTGEKETLANWIRRKARPVQIVLPWAYSEPGMIILLPNLLFIFFM